MRMPLHVASAATASKCLHALNKAHILNHAFSDSVPTHVSRGDYDEAAADSLPAIEVDDSPPQRFQQIAAIRSHFDSLNQYFLHFNGI